MKTLIILSAMLFSLNSFAAGFGAIKHLSKSADVRATLQGQEITSIELIRKNVATHKNFQNGKRVRVVNRVYLVSGNKCAAEVRVRRARDLQKGEGIGKPRFKVTILETDCETVSVPPVTNWPFPVPFSGEGGN